MDEDWSARTRLVHGGARRSQYGETSEAIFLTQGFVYPDAETAEARFIASGPDEFIYARYGNPTVRMFEERMAQLEGAEDAFATASGMAAVHGALFSLLKAGDHVVAARALFGSCLFICETLLPRFGVEVSFVDGTDLDQWQAALRPGTSSSSSSRCRTPRSRSSTSPASPSSRTRSARWWCDNVFPTPVFQRCLHAGRRRGDLLRHQAHRRPGPLPRRHRARPPRLRPRPARDLPQAHRRSAQPIQRLGDAEGSRDPRPALPRPGGDSAGAGRGAAGPPGTGPGDLSRPARPPAGGAGRAGRWRPAAQCWRWSSPAARRPPSASSTR